MKDKKNLCFQDLWKFDQTDQELPIPIYFISGRFECEKNQKYFSSFCTLGRLILTNPLFVLDSKESLDQYLIFVSAWLNLRTQIHGMPRHSIR